jgi:hydrogenase nickel incorporation protein HypA/HybF
MHELSIALSIIDTAEEQAEQLGAARVLAVHLKLGPLSGVVKEALLASYEMAAEQSSIAGCRLVIVETDLRAFCPSCAAERPVISPVEICCSECGTPTPQITSGRELEVVAMEISQ